MRNPVAASIVALLAVLALSSAVWPKASRAELYRRVTSPRASPQMPNPPGPAPKHDLTGAWVGPQNSNGSFP